MKKYTKVLVFAAILALIIVPAQALTVSDPMCKLIARMQDVFKLLRILAFVGAGFYMAGWAWDYISNAGSDKGFKLEDVKKKGISLLVGFTLLFAIGVVISFLLSATGDNDASCVGSGW